MARSDDSYLLLMSDKELAATFPARTYDDEKSYAWIGYVFVFTLAGYFLLHLAGAILVLIVSGVCGCIWARARAQDRRERRREAVAYAEQQKREAERIARVEAERPALREQLNRECRERWAVELAEIMARRPSWLPPESQHPIAGS